MTVSARYFDTLGVRMIRGRPFRRADTDAGGVAVIDERLAEMAFPGADPIGRRLRLDGVLSTNKDAERGGWLTVVGVVSNVRQRVPRAGSRDPVVYRLMTGTEIAPYLIVRSDLDAGAVTSALRHELRSLNPDLPLVDFRTLDDEIGFQLRDERLFGSMFAVFAGIALVLSSAGLYAVTAYWASQRMREIGIRIALGAQAIHVWWLVTRGGAAQLASGLVLGSAGSLALARLLPATISGTSGESWLTVSAVAGLLVVVGFVAFSVPARRAMSLDPALSLRRE